MIIGIDTHVHSYLLIQIFLSRQINEGIKISSHDNRMISHAEDVVIFVLRDLYFSGFFFLLFILFFKASFHDLDIP